MTDLLVSIRAPEPVAPALDKAKQILSAGLNWYELAALLEQVAIVVSAALDSDQREFEAFLQNLNIHLSGVGRSFVDLGTIGESLMSSGDNFDRDIRADVEGLAGNLETAHSVESLQSSVQNHLDVLLVKLNEFQQERAGLKEQYEQRIDAMQNRIDDLEESAKQASIELQEQLSLIHI